MKAFAREAFYIPLKKIPDHQLKQAFEANTLHFYQDEAVCERCDYFQERHSETCDSCPNHTGTAKLAKIVERNGKDYLSLPIGDRKSLKQIFGDTLEIVPKFKIHRMKSKPKFTGKLKDYQEPVMAPLSQGKRGILKSAPRTGKTVMMAKFICDKRYKTLILAAQQDWLENFHETFVGSKTQESMTDIDSKRIGFARTVKDFEKFDVSLSTYQAFLSKRGKKVLKKIKNMFTVVCVDEVHRAGAKCHSQVLGNLNAKYKIGLTATVKRKDFKHLIVEKIIGPILCETRTERLVPRLKFVDTKVKPYHNYKTWAGIVRFLETHPKRLSLLADWAVKDAQNGHMVLIPLARIISIKALTQAINIKAGKEIATAFHGGLTKDARKDVIRKAREYKIKVIVGQVSLLTEGINIPRASCIYQCSPSSNPPKAEQRFSRILTPMEDKPEPVIRVFGDDMNVVRSCFRNEYWRVLNKLFKPTMVEQTREKLMNWMNQKKESYDSFHSGGVV